MVLIPSGVGEVCTLGEWCPAFFLPRLRVLIDTLKGRAFPGVSITSLGMGSQADRVLFPF